MRGSNHGSADDNDVWDRILRERQSEWSQVPEEHLVFLVQECHSRMRNFPPPQSDNAKDNLFNLFQLCIQRAHDGKLSPKQRRKSFEMLERLMQQIDNIVGDHHEAARIRERTPPNESSNTEKNPKNKEISNKVNSGRVLVAASTGQNGSDEVSRMAMDDSDMDISESAEEGDELTSTAKATETKQKSGKHTRSDRELSTACNEPPKKNAMEMKGQKISESTEPTRQPAAATRRVGPNVNGVASGRNGSITDPTRKSADTTGRWGPKVHGAAPRRNSSNDTTTRWGPKVNKRRGATDTNAATRAGESNKEKRPNSNTVEQSSTQRPREQTTKEKQPESERGEQSNTQRSRAQEEHRLTVSANCSNSAQSKAASRSQEITQPAEQQSRIVPRIRNDEKDTTSKVARDQNTVVENAYNRTPRSPRADEAEFVVALGVLGNPREREAATPLPADCDRINLSATFGTAKESQPMSRQDINGQKSSTGTSDRTLTEKQPTPRQDASTRTMDQTPTEGWATSKQDINGQEASTRTMDQTPTERWSPQRSRVGQSRPSDLATLATEPFPSPNDDPAHPASKLSTASPILADGTTSNPRSTPPDAVEAPEAGVPRAAGLGSSGDHRSNISFEEPRRPNTNSQFVQKVRVPRGKRLTAGEQAFETRRLLPQSQIETNAEPRDSSLAISHGVAPHQESIPSNAMQQPSPLPENVERTTIPYHASTGRQFASVPTGASTAVDGTGIGVHAAALANVETHLIDAQDGTSRQVLETPSVPEHIKWVVFQPDDRRPYKSGSQDARSLLKVCFKPEPLLQIQVERAKDRLEKWNPFWTNSLGAGIIQTSTILDWNPTNAGLMPFTAACCSFSIPQDIARRVKGWGCTTTERPQNGDYRLVLQMLPLETADKKRADTHIWPIGTFVQVNGKPVRVRQRNQQSHNHALWKGMSHPLDLTEHIDNPITKHTLEVCCHDTKRYLLIVDICRYNSVDAVFEGSMAAMKRCSLRDSTIAAMEFAMEQTVVLDGEDNAGVDDAGKEFTFSLKCPISKTLIETPVRGKTCQHWQCFDLKSFLHVHSNVSGGRWKCAVCDKFLAPQEGLQLCGLYLDVLQKCLNVATVERHEVLFRSNGDWFLLEKSEKILKRRQNSINIVNEAPKCRRSSHEDREVICID